MENICKEKKSYLCSVESAKKRKKTRFSFYKTACYGIINTKKKDMIKNIIFDLGGVVLDICYENIAEAFERHCVKGTEYFYGRTFQTPEMDLFETGRMSVADFRDYIRRMTQSPLTDDAIDEILNAILIDVPEPRVTMLKRLKGHYDVFLFSNTNQINYDSYTQSLDRKYGCDFFAECFKACYFSHIMHLRKPDLEGFRLILDEQHLKADETLFIDDNITNVEAARRAGLRGHHLKEGDVTSLFDERGMLNIAP